MKHLKSALKKQGRIWKTDAIRF